MDTVTKGDSYEQIVHQHLSGLLSKRQLWFDPDCAKVYRKKAYYSRDRESDIVVDISIEASLPHSSEPSIITVVECKDYSHPVPVDDVEEFSEKLRQITGANVKGLMVTSSTYQAGAITFAKSRGIGLARYLPDADLLWDVKRVAAEDPGPAHLRRKEFEIDLALMSPTYSSPYWDLFARVGDNVTNYASGVVESLFSESVQGLPSEARSCLIAAEPDGLAPRIPFLDSADIEERAQALLREVAPDVLLSPRPTPLQAIVRGIALDGGVRLIADRDLGLDAHGRSVLGRLVCAPPTIFVSQALSPDSDRWRFVLAHEIGHLALGHDSLLNAEVVSDDRYGRRHAADQGGDELQRAEFQANRFAASLLLPRPTFVRWFWHTMDALGINPRNHGGLFVDHQECNRRNYFALTDSMKHAFLVSREAIHYHLLDLGLMVEAPRIDRFAWPPQAAEVGDPDESEQRDLGL